MIHLKSADDIAAMREAGRIVAQALAAVRSAAAIGTTLRELDDVAASVIRGAGATPAFLGYHPRFAPTPFPGTVCASVNDVIVHGIPDGHAIADGDLVSIDCGAVLDGWVGDAATTFTVGDARPADLQLLEVTEAALAAGIGAALPGNRLGDIGAAIGSVGRGHGFGIPSGWGGHGIGRAMHEDPSVPNEGRPGRGLQLRPGMVIAIEPMFLAGGDDEYRLADDGWAVHTADGSRAAHAEHSVAITADGPEILTLP